MRSARGDRLPPAPLEKQGSKRRAAHLGRREARAEPGGCLLPFTCLGWTLGLRDGHIASYICPSPGPPTHASASLIRTLASTSPLASQLLVFPLQSTLHTPQGYRCSSPAPLGEVPKLTAR